MSVLELSPTIGLSPPSYEGGDSSAPTIYKVWLPTDITPGLVQTQPRYSFDRTKASHYFEHHYSLEQLASLGALGQIVTEAGYDMARDGETTFTRFPSSANIIAYTEKRAALSRGEPSFIRFKEYPGATFSDVEFFTNLRDGFVLFSNSTAPHREYTSEHLFIAENHPRLIHDMLVHVPAWLCLPPAITYELQLAAGRILDERERRIANGEPMHSIKFAISDMMNRIDSLVNTYNIRTPFYSWAHTDPAFGEALGKITGKQSRSDALHYERLVRDYAADPFIVGVEHARFIGSTTRKRMQRVA